MAKELTKEIAYKAFQKYFQNKLFVLFGSTVKSGTPAIANELLLGNWRFYLKKQ